RINDYLGYRMGDDVLRHVANRIQTELPPGGYLAHISSSDFIALIPQFSAKNEISTLAESIIRHVEKPVAINDYKLHMTTSVGISFYPEDGIRKHAIIES